METVCSDGAAIETAPAMSAMRVKRSAVRMGVSVPRSRYGRKMMSVKIDGRPPTFPGLSIGGGGASSLGVPPVV